MSRSRPDCAPPFVYGEVATNDYILESMGCGVAFLDYDNDGFDDIFITCWGQNVLFHHNATATAASPM